MFPNFTLTKDGENLLNSCIGAKKIITFTRIKLGKGNLGSQEIRDMKDIVTPFKEIPILETQVLENKMTKIISFFDNKDLKEDVLWKEIGVFARVGEQTETEILYSYSNAGNEGILIPSNERSTSFRRTLDIRNYIGYATDITFNITDLKDHYQFNTLSEMKSATYLREGDKVGLWGESVLGNKAIRMYIIQNTNSSGVVQLANNLYAKLYFDSSTLTPNSRQINVGAGLKGSGTLASNINITVDSLTDDEVDTLLNFEEFEDLITLATESDIRNLFAGTSLSGGQSYNLSQLSTDEQKIVNMRLLSLFNDLILQKLKTSETSLTNLINTKANNTITITAGKGLDGGGNLNNSITLNIVSKNDGIIVNENDIQLNIVDNLEDSSSTRAASSRIVKKVNDEKVDKTTQIIVGEGLLGTGTLNKNLNITLDVLSDSDIDELLGDI